MSLVPIYLLRCDLFSIFGFLELNVLVLFSREAIFKNKYKTEHKNKAKLRQTKYTRIAIMSIFKEVK